MAKVIALSPVDHDGVLREEGDEFEVKDQSQIEALKAAGAILVKGEKKPAAEQPAE